jgi:hypothetical protein
MTLHYPLAVAGENGRNQAGLAECGRLLWQVESLLACAVWQGEG